MDGWEALNAAVATARAEVAAAAPDAVVASEGEAYVMRILTTSLNDTPNRVDTLDRRRGALICRFIGAINITVPKSVLRSDAV